MLKRHVWLIGILVMSIIAGSIWSLNQTVSAQDGTNLLTNGSFEGAYYGQGAPTRTVPNGWTISVSEGAPEAFPHNDPIQVIDGSVSWNLKQGYAPFTAVAYQQVSGLNDGDGVKFTAYGWVYTCNNTATSCVIADPPYRKSDTAAGASLRIGIDPEGGTDPTAGRVKWSSPTAPYDQWAEMSVSATVKGGTVTVFIYMTQTAGLAINNVYWDKASLVRTEIVPDATATAPFVPFVVPQSVRPDGSIVHSVQAQDTLSSIAFAYRDYGVTQESIAALNGMKPNTRFLQIGQQLIILPPGSVDPATGQLIPEGQSATATPQAPAPAATLPPAATAVAQQPAPVATQATQAPAETSTETLPMGGPAAEAQPISYATVRAAFYPFENGFMFWLEDTNEIYVLVNVDSPLGGTYSTYQDTWTEAMPETDPTLQPPAGLTQPDRSFGHVWRNYGRVKDDLGWGTGSTEKYTALVVRDGDTLIISSPDNRVYQLTPEKTWSAMDYSQDSGQETSSS